MSKALKLRTVACIRCGICCISGPCLFGKEDPQTGICEYFEFSKEGYAICGIYEEIKDKGSMFGSGCFIRARPEIYEMLKTLAEEKIGRKIKGIE